MARPYVAAGLLMRDAAGRILMVRPTYKDGWDMCSCMPLRSVFIRAFTNGLA